MDSSKASNHHRCHMEWTMSATAWKVLNKLRLERKLCDVAIRVHDVEFSAHKIVLSACSNFFRALFMHDWDQPEERTHSIPGVSSDVMRLLLDFAYTHSTIVTMKNVEELLVAANYLSMPGVVQLCCDFLQKRLCPKNCIGIWRFADVHSCPELSRKAYLYMLRHFEEMVRISEDFPKLTLPQLAGVIDEDMLNVKQESVAFEAVLRWIYHCTHERKGYIALLLSKIRLGLMTTVYFMPYVKNNDLVKESAECKPLIIDALKAMYDLNLNEPSSGFCNPLTRPRLPCAILLAIGGFSEGHPTNGIEAYDARADRWVNVTNEEESPRAGHGAAFLGGYAYSIGGFDGVVYFNSVRRLDLVTRTWHQVAPMYMRRCCVSVAVLEGCIYALGGFDGYLMQKTAERYEPATNQWTLIAPMSKRRRDGNATTLHGRVYICGGFTGDEHLMSAEYYNPATDQWTVMNPMTNRRSGLGVVAYGHYVYAVGGFDGHNYLCSAEAYNPLNNTWRAVPAMSSCRSKFGMEVVDDLLFVVGGFDGLTNMFKVECYNEKTDEWYEAEDMGISRAMFSCCVVHDLPNMEEYAAPRHAPPRPDSAEGEPATSAQSTPS